MPDIQTILFLSALSLIILLLPGAAWMVLIPSKAVDLPSRLAEAVGLSIAINAILWLSTAYLHYRLPDCSWFLFYSVCLLVILLKMTVGRLAIRFNWQLVATVFSLFLLTGFRLYQVKDLAFPAWVDSVQHATIIKWLLLESRVSAPPNYLPLFYYFGFHGLVTTLVSLSGISLEQCLLVFGQVLGAMVPFVVYRLGRALFSDFRPSLAAALLVAFFSQMPAYYSSWGRYTLLAGSMLCALAMAQVMIMRLDKPGWGDAAVLSTLIAGAWLTHYLTAMLLVVFLVLFVLARSWMEVRTCAFRSGQWAMIAAGTSIGGFLCLPWLIHAWQYVRLEAGFSFIFPGATDSRSLAAYSMYLVKMAGPTRNYIFMGLGFLGLILAFKRTNLRPFAAWGLFMGLSSLPIGLHLNPFRADHLLILLWLPFSLFTGHLLVSAVAVLDRIPSGERWKTATIFILLAGASIWGFFSTRSIINLQTILADKWDRDAIHWVKANLVSPSFLINVTPWQSDIYRGVDGGYWLGLLTDATVHPDIYIYTWQEPWMKDITQSEVESVAGFRECDSKFWDYLSTRQIKYIYAHAGTTGVQPGILSHCSGIKQVYTNKHVFLYQIDETGAIPAAY